jgi:hypothetical protein
VYAHLNTTAFRWHGVWLRQPRGSCGSGSC